MLRLFTNTSDSSVQLSPSESNASSNWRRFSPEETAAAAAANTANRMILALQISPSIKDVDKILSLLPNNIPPGINISSIISKLQTVTYVELIDSMRNNGEFNFKRMGPQYEDFGNWFYGFASSEKGIPKGIALWGAGLYQIITNPVPGTGQLDLMRSFTDPFHGDQSKDQIQISNGFDARNFLGQTSYLEGAAFPSIMRESSSPTTIRVSQPSSDSGTPVSNTPN